MKQIFRKPTTWLVLGLIALFLWSISREASAETWLEVAPNSVFVGGDYEDSQVSLVLRERWQNKYEVGLTLLVDYANRDDGNTGFEVMRVTQYKRIEAGIGYTFWSDQSRAWDTDRTFALMLGWRGDRWAVRIRHWSTGGTSPLNQGLDMLTIGRSFGDGGD